VTDYKFTLHHAAESGVEDRVQELLGRDAFNGSQVPAPANLRDVDGTPSFDEVGVNEKDLSKRWTPLHYAAARGHTGVVTMLLKARANPNIKDDDLRTPLHMAAGWGNSDCVGVMLEFGADKTMTDSGGNTPQQLAAGMDRPDVEGTLARWDMWTGPVEAQRIARVSARSPAHRNQHRCSLTADRPPRTSIVQALELRDTKAASAVAAAGEVGVSRAGASFPAGPSATDPPPPPSPPLLCRWRKCSCSSRRWQ
jgi:hypothetical protein